MTNAVRHNFRLIGVSLLVSLLLMHRSLAQDVITVNPDQNLQAALDAAPSGATINLLPGIYKGPITIHQPLVLKGQKGAWLKGSGTGSVIIIVSDGVTVQSMRITGSGRNFSANDSGVLVLGNNASLKQLVLEDNLFGIYILRALYAHISDNDVTGLAIAHQSSNAPAPSQTERDEMSDGMHDNPSSAQALVGNGIHLFNANDATIQGNRIQFVRDGIYVAHTSHAVFRANRVHDSRYGIHYMYSNYNEISDNVLWRNVAGPALMFSHDLKVSNNMLRDHGGLRAYGLLLQDIEQSQFTGNQILGNRIGIRLQNCNDNTFMTNRISGNLGGMTIDSASSDNIFTQNTFGFNLHQIELSGFMQDNQWSVNGVGNRWMDSLPLDLNGDGISELPHHETDLLGGLRQTFAPIQLLTGSPGIRLLEWALQQAPIRKSRYVTDPHPLTRQFQHDASAAH